MAGPDNSPILLRWPWSLFCGDYVAIDGNTSTEFFGGNLLYAVQHRSMSSDIAPLCRADDLIARPALYDIAHSRSKDGDVTLNLGIEGHLTIRGFSSRSAQQERTYADDWADFFEELNYEVVNKEGPTTWGDIVQFIKQASEEKKDAELALIVEIAEQLTGTIAETVRGMSASLRHERLLQPIAAAREFDEQCIARISEFPGETLIEKVKGQSKVPSIRRRASYDLFHNQILKDFLSLCVKAARYYDKKTHKKFSKSARFLSVKRFGVLCESLQQDPRFEEIEAPNLSTPPSYAILHDARYRIVWKYYLRLLRIQQERDDIWRWQDRTWGQIVKLLVSSSLYETTKISESNTFSYSLKILLEGEPVFTHQQQRGVRFQPSSESGPFLLKARNQKNGAISSREYIVDVVDAEDCSVYPLKCLEELSLIGARMFLVFNPVNSSDKKIPIIAIWSLNQVASSNPLPNNALVEALEAALSEANRRVSGVMIKGLVLSSVEDQSEVVTDTPSCCVLNVSRDYKEWKAIMVEELPLCLDYLIEKGEFLGR